jgi:hypothetical protein
MKKILRSPGLARAVLLAAGTFATIALPLSGLLFSQASLVASEASSAQDPYGQDNPVPIPDPFLQPPIDDGDMPRRPYSRSKSAKKKTRPADKGTGKKTDSDAKANKAGAGKTAGDPNQLSFARDIAPILVANCTECHSGDRPGLTKGKLDLSSFDSLKKGTSDHKVISPGKPDESSLVLRIKGEETPRMPRGSNRPLSDVAIAKIERWVKAGALLDAGLDSKKPLKSYAAKADEVRRAELAKLPAKDRDEKTKAVGLQRWKQANPKLNPDVVPGEHFVLFSTLPRDRATTTLRSMELQYGHLKRMLGPSWAEWVEKVGLYVFPTRKDLIEFVRAIENGRDLDAEDFASAKLTVDQPYVAVVDPGAGRNEEPGASRRRGRPKRFDEGSGEGGGSDRTINGLLTEALGISVIGASGSPPRWLVLGIGSYLAAQVEPRSVYYRQLRQTAFANFRQGWPNRANEALGGTDQITPDNLHAMGFALVEAMMTTEPRAFPNFVVGMLQGGEKLDETLGRVYRGTREEFINDTGEWVAARYGQLQ